MTCYCNKISQLNGTLKINQLVFRCGAYFGIVLITVNLTLTGSNFFTTTHSVENDHDNRILDIQI